MLYDISFITAHFQDFEWTQLLVESIRQNTPPESITEIIIIDQDRSEESRTYLQNLDIKVRVVQYPKSEPHFLKLQHDHPAVLNTALEEAKGKYILIFDSDAHPMSSHYLNKIEEKLQDHDCVLAEDPRQPGLTHPCFMVLQRKHVELDLAFDKDMFSNELDTGRLIAQQLIEAGEKVYICPAEPAFHGGYGTIYLGTVYHHGHGSFNKNPSSILQNQVAWEQDYFRSYVIKDRQYKLSSLHFARFRLLKFIKSLPSSYKRILSRIRKIFKV